MVANLQEEWGTARVTFFSIYALWLLSPIHYVLPFPAQAAPVAPAVPLVPPAVRVPVAPAVLQAVEVREVPVPIPPDSLP